MGMGAWQAARRLVFQRRRLGASRLFSQPPEDEPQSVTLLHWRATKTLGSSMIQAVDQLRPSSPLQTLKKNVLRAIAR